MAKRVLWKRVKAKALTMHNQTLYERYAQAFEAANDLGRQLKEAVSSDWNNRYPDGMDGQICIFNAIGGTLMYTMKDKPKLGDRITKQFDADRGDDVFACPSAELTIDLAKVDVGTDESNTLAIISERLQHALSGSAEDEEQESAAPKAAGPGFSQRLRGMG